MSAFHEVIANLVFATDSSLSQIQLIAKLGQLLSAERVRIYRFSPDGQILTNTHSWHRPGLEKLESSWKSLAVSEIPWILSQLETQSVNLIKDLNTIPSESEQALIKRLSQNSCCLVATKYKDQKNGLIIIDDPSGLTDDQLGNLELLGTILGRMSYQSQPTLDSASLDPDTEHIYQLSFKSLDEGLILLDKQQHIIKVNGKTCEWLNQPEDFFAGKQLREIESLFPEGTLNLVTRNFGLVSYGNKSSSAVEFVQLNSANEERHYQIGSLSLVEHKKFIGALLYIRDITYRKNMEDAAQESERRLRRVVESIKEGITLSDDKGYFEIFNEEMSELTGYSREEANNAPDFIEKIHTQEELEQAKDRILQLEAGKKVASAVKIKDKNGDTKYVHVSTTILNTSGKRHYLSAYHDLTEQELAKQELKQRNEELSRLAEELEGAKQHLAERVLEKTKELQSKVTEVENLARFPSEDPFPTLRIKSDGILLYANSASQALLDRWQIKVGNKVPDGWVKLIGEVFALNNRKIYELEILGQVISFVLVPVRSGDYVNLYGRDVSKEKEVDKIKNQFISMVSHQIRTPITSVRWYSEMLLKGDNKNPLNDHQRDITETIHTTAVSLTDLVNDLLSISRMESGKIEYNPERGNIVELFKDVLNELKSHADHSQIILEFNYTDIPNFNFDPQMIKEVTRNIISNAIKYTPQAGVVKVNLRVNNAIVECSVIDSGIGIPKAAQADIFKRFYRAQNAVDNKYEGTGLGLSVAKMIIEKAGGKIWFESEENKGATFHFTLPIGIEI